MVNKKVSVDEVITIILVARNIVATYNSGEKDIENLVMQLTVAFQKLHDGYEGHNSLEENYEVLLEELKRINPDDI